MSQEVERFLALARSFLTKAEGMRQHGWPEEAGRASYLAAFHRAQAVIFHQSGRVVKTHQGVHAKLPASSRVCLVRTVRSGNSSAPATT